MAHQPISIIGGGLAGLTLGIALRQQKVPVTIWEAGSYPRHRVCGEFISGRGLEVLDRLGLRESLREAGAIEARTTAFFLGDKLSATRELPEPALCLSRFHLDHLLAKAFRESGGELREKQRWSGSELAAGMVRATGRRVMTGARWRFIGLKVHARDLSLCADLEMHFRPRGYVGLCRLASGEYLRLVLERRERSSGPGLARAPEGAGRVWAGTTFGGSPFR
jgi:menaquinone-9 beta-reductase